MTGAYVKQRDVTYGNSRRLTTAIAINMVATFKRVVWATTRPMVVARPLRCVSAMIPIMPLASLTVGI